MTPVSYCFSQSKMTVKERVLVMEVRVAESSEVEKALALLDGDAPDVFGGVGRLNELAEAGSITAMEHLATAAAAGICMDQSIEAALDLLALAAEGGSAFAARQRDLLAQPVKPPSLQVVLNGDPLVIRVSRFLSADHCDWLRERAEPWLDKADVFDAASGVRVAHPARRSAAAELSFRRSDAIIEQIRSRICQTGRLPLEALETANVLRYRPGDGFDEHVDYLDPDQPGFRRLIEARGQRIATALIYLNDDFEDGETTFSALGLTIRPSKGDLLLFSNLNRAGDVEPRSRHAGLSPQSGEKWVFSQWLREPPEIDMAVFRR